MNPFLLALLLALDLTNSCETKCFISNVDTHCTISMNYLSEDENERFLCDPILFQRHHLDTLIIYVSGVRYFALRQNCDVHFFKSLECPDILFELDSKNSCIWISFWNRRIKLSKRSMI